MAFNDLRDVLIHELRDIYSAERQIARVMPRLVKAVHDEHLRKALLEHGAETMTQLQRLELLFEMIGGRPGRHVSKGMQGILSEADDLLGKDAEKSDEDALDAAIIAFAQRVEHYEIGAYMAARKHAEVLQREDVQSVIDDLLREELVAHQSLVTAGQEGINRRAAGLPDPRRQRAADQSSAADA